MIAQKHLFHGSSSFRSYRRRYNDVETAAIATLAPYRISRCEYGNPLHLE